MIHNGQMEHVSQSHSCSTTKRVANGILWMVSRANLCIYELASEQLPTHISVM